MPDWPTIQAAAASTNRKIVIRLPIPERDTGSAYYFQLHSVSSIRNKYTLVIPTDHGDSAIFHRFFAKDNHKTGYGRSRLYNSLLSGNWGFFLPIKNGQWYEYQTVTKPYWEFDKIWAFPKTGPFSVELLLNDPQAIWGTKIPVPPTDKQNETEYAPDNENSLEEDDIFESSGHLADPLITSTLLAHAIAGTATPTIISETLESILGSPTNSDETSNPDAIQRSHTGPLIDISVLHGTSDSDDTSIPPGQREPANINSPARPDSDEWLQPPLTRKTQVITPEERPTTLGFAEFTRNAATHWASTPMDRLANLHHHLKQTGYVAGSSQHPILIDRQPEYQNMDPRVLSDERVRELGILDAQISNLENAIIRNNNKQSDGRPPVILTGNKIQSPSPDVVFTEDLLKAFNTVAIEAMTKLGNLLIGSQLSAIEDLWERRKALLTDWQPNEQETEAAKRIEASRTHKETVYKARPIAGGRPTFRLDIQDNGPSFIPALEPTSTSGFRQPANKNIPRSRQPQSPPRVPDQYTGARPRVTTHRVRYEPPTRPRYEERDDEHDRDEPRYDRYRRTRYFHPN